MVASDSAYMLKTYGSKVRARNTFQDVCCDRADWRVDMGHTNSQVSRRYDELIAKQAAKNKGTNRQSQRTNTRARHSKVAYVLGQHFTRHLHVKRDCNTRALTLNATHAGYNEYARADNSS